MPEFEEALPHRTQVSSKRSVETWQKMLGKMATEPMCDLAISAMLEERRAIAERLLPEPPSQYLLVYYDGQIVEVSKTSTQEVLFRNITANCHQQLNYKHDWTPFSQSVSNK